jgi:transposase InsO family protein
MGQVLHGSATTTEAVRRAIQHSQESLRTLAKRYGINQKTVAKWKGRTSVADLPTGPKKPRSTVLTTEEEAVVVAFRRHTLLPLDDCLYALQPTVPNLTRSSLHRCLQRHGVSRLPQMEGDKEPRRKFKTYPIGFFHVDIAEVQTAQGKLYLFVAIDRTSKFAVAQLVHKANTQTARAFLEALVAAVPYRVEIVLTDNGIQFADLPKNRSGPTARLRGHPFDRACREHGIDHRLTKPHHPWTNGQVERMNRTIKDATVKRYHYDSHDQFVRHLDDFVAAYNFGRRLKTLTGLTPYEFVCKRWTIEPERFRLNPLQQMPGLNTPHDAGIHGSPIRQSRTVASRHWRQVPSAHLQDADTVEMQGLGQALEFMDAAVLEA